jgi:NTE family protein
VKLHPFRARRSHSTSPVTLSLHVTLSRDTVTLAPARSPLDHAGRVDVEPVGRPHDPGAVDFDLINSENYKTRLSLGSVNARSGQLVYFDTTTDVIRAEHVMASGALPPGFPAIEIDGEYYWDGGVVSNTPLAWIARQHPPSMLAFQVDLWAAPGPFPKNIQEVMIRMKEILNSSRTIYHTSGYKEFNHLRSNLARFLEQVPEEFKRGEEAKYLMSVARQQVHHLVNLVYRPTSPEDASKENEFSRKSVEERWLAGYRNTVHALRHPEVLERAAGCDAGIFVFDFAKDGG